MCDYSLHSVKSRPACTRDRLVTTGFPGTTSRGFSELGEPLLAVCLLPGTELAFDQEPQRAGALNALLARFGIGRIGTNLARFRRLDPDYEQTHHDALEFSNGKVVFLTELREGERALVLQLPVSTVHSPSFPIEAAQTVTRAGT
jgi:hypothetical protein